MKTSAIRKALAAGLVAAALVPPATAAPAQTAQAEYEQVLALTPDLDNGRQVYLTCAVCHRPEGWGTPDGTYPMIAGQLRTVLIKQLADIRARNRDNPLMYPFSVPRILGGPQNLADVAAYVAQLPMNPNNGVGPGRDLAFGESLYREHCAKCHGEAGQGQAEEHMPAIAGQHYAYLMRQFDWIRLNRRKNADAKMVRQIERFSPREQSAVLDYSSRLRPAAGKLAAPDWQNPDFPHYARPVIPEPAFPPMPDVPQPPSPADFPPPRPAAPGYPHR